jgi:hypothetical protein
MPTPRRLSRPRRDHQKGVAATVEVDLGHSPTIDAGTCHHDPLETVDYVSHIRLWDYLVARMRAVTAEVGAYLRRAAG